MTEAQKHINYLLFFDHSHPWSNFTFTPLFLQETPELIEVTLHPTTTTLYYNAKGGYVLALYVPFAWTNWEEI